MEQNGCSDNEITSERHAHRTEQDYNFLRKSQLKDTKVIEDMKDSHKLEEKF